jgi:hypothetical protein
VPAREATDRRSLDQIAGTSGLDAGGLAAMLRVSVAELERSERAGVPASRERELDDLVLIAETLGSQAQARASRKARIICQPGGKPSTANRSKGPEFPRSIAPLLPEKSGHGP